MKISTRPKPTISRVAAGKRKKSGEEYNLKPIFKFSLDSLGAGTKVSLINHEAMVDKRNFMKPAISPKIMKKVAQLKRRK